MDIKDLFKQDDFATQYELAREQGDRRFASDCRHIHTKNGRCLKCLRKVVDRPVRRGTRS